MSSVWRTIRGYIWWSHERGTLHYDVMVSLILVFVFFSPYVINFKDKPVVHNPHPTGLMVAPDPGGGFIYEIPASAVKASDDPSYLPNDYTMFQVQPGNCDKWRAQTPHSEMHVALADGSVTSVSASISPANWRSLLKPRDGAGFMSDN